MKKTIFKGFLMAAAALCLLFSSCSKTKTYLIDSTQTIVDNTVIITNDLWDDTRDVGILYYDYRCSAITPDVLREGNVNVYLLLSSGSTEYQEPLPYVYSRQFTDGTGATVYRPVNLRFDISNGMITFMVSDLDDYLTQRNELLTMRFRVVITKPITYAIDIEQ